VLFLDSLIMPNHSYILRSYLEQEEDNNVWSRTSSKDRNLIAAEAERLPGIELMTKNAHLKHVAVLQDLRARLNANDFRRMLFYISTLADLVDLTERKNTDLHRCGNALFATNTQREHTNRLLGISETNSVEYRSDEDRRKLVEAILQSLRTWGYWT
jgi:hypothetical protein